VHFDKSNFKRAIKFSINGNNVFNSKEFAKCNTCNWNWINLI
jgi:hypothetical protein